MGFMVKSSHSYSVILTPEGVLHTEQPQRGRRDRTAKNTHTIGSVETTETKEKYIQYG